MGYLIPPEGSGSAPGPPPPLDKPEKPPKGGDLEASEPDEAPQPTTFYVEERFEFPQDPGGWVGGDEPHRWGNNLSWCVTNLQFISANAPLIASQLKWRH